MTNSEIARSFRELAALMELHEENPFKIRSYQNAYRNLRKLTEPLAERSIEELKQMRGIGNTIASKIRELVEEGQSATLEKYRNITPPGIREMLEVKGLGPKKIRTVWKDLGVESIGELLYACNENRLIELKGFGVKTQAELIKVLKYYMRSKGKFHYASLEPVAEDIILKMKKHLPELQIELTGEMRRRNNVVSKIELLAIEDKNLRSCATQIGLKEMDARASLLQFKTEEDIEVDIYVCETKSFGSKMFRYTGSPDFLKNFIQKFPETDFKNLSDEKAIFKKVNLPYIAPEQREASDILERAARGDLPPLIESSDIQGVVHVHTDYSDGMHSLKEMCEAAQQAGYSYIVVTDHSKSAFYAGGLKEEELHRQWLEIDHLNESMHGFHIFKGIESDILADGSLDYDSDVLKQFDCIIASIHSNLKMDEQKATRRLLRAIENPHTKILGHPTGRLLLSREGYPINHPEVIDACAANGVAIELNANPYRLDLDWTWIPYAMQKGVPVSINPDAHSIGGIGDIKYGVYAARKGGLTKMACLNTKSKDEFKRFLE